MIRNTLLIVLFACQTAYAHHGFGNFNMSEEIEITGTVAELAFVNPHSWIYLDVVGPDGQHVPYRCEMRSATTLRRSGWSPEMFPAGRRITIAGAPDRTNPHACYVSTITFADGSSIDRYGQRTPPTISNTGPRTPRLASGEPNITGEWAAEQLVMSDPRGVGGSLVPLSEAEAPNAGGAPGSDSAAGPGSAAAGPGSAAPRQAPGARGREGAPPLIAGEAARRLFVARVGLTEAGQAAAEAMRQAVNPAMRCAPISVLVDWSYDAPVNRITQNEDTIVLEYGKFDYARTVHMDGSGHPASLEPSLTGHSIGHWDGDVLVVDTVGFASGALTRVLPNSDRLHFVERFSLDADSMALRRDFVAEDPAYFTEPYTGYDVVYPSNVPYQPSACDDRSIFE